MRRKYLWFTPVFALSLVALPGCGSDDADAAAGSCTVADLGDGTSAIRCPDGTELVVQNGKEGPVGKDGDKGDKGDKGDAADCTLGTSADGKDTLTCGDQTVTIGDPCEDGYYGDVYLWNRDHSGSKAFTLFQVTNCTWIRGNLDIDDFDGETLPKALSRIEKIDGDLFIEDTANLKTIAFPSLKTIGGELYVSNNEALTDIEAFPALEMVGDWITVVENPALERMGSFDSLKNLGALQMWDNHSLESLADFPLLETVEGFGEEDPGYSVVYIESHDALASIEGLRALKQVNGHVTIENNPSLAQCQVDELLDGIEITGTVWTGDNDDDATCP